MLCRELVGRAGEVVELDEALTRARHGEGRLVTLVGEAGAGKSRLLSEAVATARADGMIVLSGRSVPGPAVPYRALSEALLGMFRSAPFPDVPELIGFGAHLGRLVPNWGSGEGEQVEESPVLIGEAILRLLRVLADDAGVVLTIEDLHWADFETMSVLDYLAGTVHAEPIVCLCTSRSEGAATDLLDRLTRRDPQAVVAVGRLPDDDVDRMVAACLGTPRPPDDVLAFVHRHSDGTPLLVEELLAGLVSAGELREHEGRWESGGILTPSVPASLRDSVTRRLNTLDPQARRVVGAASLLGRSFDWELLPGIAEVDGSSAADALRAAVDAQLVAVEGGTFTFRHALTREAVLGGLLPPERSQLAKRAWPAHERANPGLPGPSLELAADLAEAAGESIRAAALLTISARRALDSGALTTAESTASRAVSLAPPASTVCFDAEEVQLHALVAAGKPLAALALARSLVDGPVVQSIPPVRRIDVLLTATRAAVMAGESANAAMLLAVAVAAAATEVDPSLAARLDAASATVALERGDLDEVAALAESAARQAAATDQPMIEGEALLLRGHVARTRDGFGSAWQWYDRAGLIAERAGLTRMHLQASQEQALLAWHNGDMVPLLEVRNLAERYGALLTVAAVDLSLADIALYEFDRAAALAAATRCAEASRRYGLSTEAVAHLWLAGAHALNGDRPALEAAVSVALAADPDDDRILADLYGRVLATAAFVDDEFERLPDLMATMIEHVRRADPVRSVYPGRMVWVVLEASDAADGGIDARDEFAEHCVGNGFRPFELVAEMAEAIALGRLGDARPAADRFAAAYDELMARRPAMSLHPIAIIAARAALRDGWGDPVRWLRDAEATFEVGGYRALARRCRIMLRDAGEPTPRRGRGESTVPVALRARGVTSREMDVVKQVIVGRTNKQIAVELYLSPKTVERHMSSLFRRLEVRSRGELAAAASEHLPDDSGGSASTPIPGSPNSVTP